jgi:hypothetical protein
VSNPLPSLCARFADIFGLDLQEVKTFTDEIPRIPRRAFQDLDVDMSDYDIGSPRGSTPVFNKFFLPQSQKPHQVRFHTNGGIFSSSLKCKSTYCTFLL